MPTPRAVTRIEVGETSFAFRARVLEDLPTAHAFLAYLLGRGGVSPPTAAFYVKLAAKLRRQGKLEQPDLITHVSDRTAANAYTRWWAEVYGERMIPLRRLFPNERDRLKYLRKHSLVPPMIGKCIPVVQLPQAAEMPADVIAAKPDHTRDLDEDKAPIVLLPAPSPEPSRWSDNTVVMTPAPNAWTLHIPHGPSEPHEDPCETCTAHVLDSNQLAVIGTAFKDAWGHLDLNALPAEAYLFGPPPVDNEISRPVLKSERVLALIGDHAITTRDELTRAVRARTTHDVDEFVARLNEGTTGGVYLSRETIGTRLQDVLGALWNAWGAKT